MGFVIFFGLFLLVVGLTTIWVWFSVLAGMRELTLGRSVFMVASLFSITAVLFVGGGIEKLSSVPLAFFIWPVAWYFALPQLTAANLNYFLPLAGMILVGTLALTVSATGKIRILFLVAGAVLAFLVPAFVEDARVNTQMKTQAETSGLVIVEQASFFRSAREGYFHNRHYHGYACNPDDWPYLWSYRQRSWIALPLDSRFVWSDLENIKSINSFCSYQRDLLASQS